MVGIVVASLFGLGVLAIPVALYLAHRRAQALPRIRHLEHVHVPASTHLEVERVLDAAEAIRPELRGRLRVTVVDNDHLERVFAQSARFGAPVPARPRATVIPRRAWSPWGWVWYDIQPSIDGLVSRLVVHEVAHHVAPHAAGWGLARDHDWPRALPLEAQIARRAGLVR